MRAGWSSAHETLVPAASDMRTSPEGPTAQRSFARGVGGLLGLVCALWATSAAAHARGTTQIEAQLHERGVALRVAVEAKQAALVLGLGDSIDADELRPHTALVQQWLTDGLRVEGEGGPCVATPSNPTLTDDGARLEVELDYVCPLPMGVIRLHDDTALNDAAHETFVSVKAPGGDAHAHVMRGDVRSVELGRKPAASETAATFVVQGALHLITGYDHMLFLLSLILGAGLVVRRRGLRVALREVAWVVTAFTVGHSLSLCAAALGWLSLPAVAVEIAIAGSIVFVALSNVARPEASIAGPWLAGSFGLVHGFGFSSVLAELGLPPAQRVLALFSFNVGIELAQLVFVSVVLVLLARLAHHDGYRRFVLQGGSLVIAICGAVWLIERAAPSLAMLGLP